MALTGYSVPETLTDDAGNSLKAVTVTVTGPSSYSGTATSDATSGLIRLGPLPIGDYTLTYQGRSVTVPVVAQPADVQAAYDGSAASAQKAANLSDLASAATARTNLGLGTAATQPISAFDAAGAAAAAQTAAVAAAATAGNASYATLNQGDTARRVAARPPAPVPLSALTPTVTLSAAGAGTSISGGVLKAPKRLTYTGADLARADMANDPHYAHFGVPNDCAQYGTSFPDYVYIAGDYLTGTPNSQVAPWQSRKGFTHTGQVFEFLFKALTTGHLYRITVNGQRLAEDFTSVTTSAGQTYRLIVDFGSSATREVIFEHDNLNFGGFQIEPAATLQRLSRRRVRIACIGDSLTGGAGPLSRLASSPEVAAAMLGCDHFYNLGVGGTGVLNTGGTGGATAATRIASDLTKAGVDPDIVLYWNGFNDAASSAAAVQTQAALDLAAIIAAKPKAIVIAVGCWTPGNPTASYINVNNAIKAAAVTAGALFIDLIDPTGLLATVPTYASGNTYRVGDYVIQNGYLWICQTATGVAGSFDSTKFRSVGVITGTGKVGTTTGDGNADVAIHTDGIHPTVIGSKIVGAFLAKRIYDLCRSMVTPA